VLREPSATPRKQPKQERAKVTVEAILIATTRILTEEGYSQLNTNRVAELAGVGIGSLYQYFPNKEALIFALAENHADEMVELVRDHLEKSENRSTLEVLSQLVKASLAVHAINPSLHRVLDQIPRSEEMRQSAEAKMGSMLLSFLKQRCDRIQAENLELTVFIICRTVEALTHEAVVHHPELLDNGQLEQEIISLFSFYLNI
jgi:AcrR family transcriptional regulator